MIKILVADDHAIVREGLKRIISEASDMEVAFEAENGQDVLDCVSQSEIDVVVLDVSMPGRNGLEVLKQLNADHSNPPALMMSVHPEEQYALRSIKAGASGYITKDSAPDVLIDAIRTVASGRKYITPTLAEKLADAIGMDATKEPHERLSNREYEIMILIAKGKTTSETASQLNLSVNTVGTYRERILAKLNLENTSQIIRYALENQLV